MDLDGSGRGSGKYLFDFGKSSVTLVTSELGPNNFESVENIVWFHSALVLWTHSALNEHITRVERTAWIAKRSRS